MRRSQRWNNLQICPLTDSNPGGSDMWSNTLPLDHGDALNYSCDLPNTKWYFTTYSLYWLSASYDLRGQGLAFLFNSFIWKRYQIKIYTGLKRELILSLNINNRSISKNNNNDNNNNSNDNSYDDDSNNNSSSNNNNNNILLLLILLLRGKSTPEKRGLIQLYSQI